MSIKMRITLGIIITIIISTMALMGITQWQMQKNAEQAYWVNAEMTLGLIDKYLTSFFEINQNNVHFLASLPEMQTNEFIFPVFKDRSTDSDFFKEPLSENAIYITDIWKKLQKSHSTYTEIFSGQSDGSYGTSLDGMISAGFASTARSWYIDSMSSNQDSLTGEAYLTRLGFPVVPIIQKVRTSNNEIAGVVAIDISFSVINELIDNLKVGETGYFVLVENSGRILSDNTNKDVNFKMVTDLPGTHYLELFNSDKFTHEVEVNGRKMFAAVMEMSGFKVFSIIEQDEVFKETSQTLWLLFYCALGIILLGASFSLWLSRSISFRLEQLVDGARKLADGDFDAIPDKKGFYGELLHLQSTLENMAKQLSSLFAHAEEKTKEAEAKNIVAQKATKEAELAKQAAEHAKQEGMLTAANQLENIVTIIVSATQELSEQIKESAEGAKQQAVRMANATTAIEKMNNTVLEVAKNASSSSELTESVKFQAEEGVKITTQCKEAIDYVREDSLVFKTNISDLAMHAQSINTVMGVISDIADQTNLLALNAAIEAARAGDAGRGFAVVADEVRKLAEKTILSTSDVAKAIFAIQESTEINVKQVDTTVKRIEDATKFADSSSNALQDIRIIADESADGVRTIAIASEEQSVTFEEITNAVSQVSTIASETSSAMAEASQVVISLSTQAQLLSSLVQNLRNN